MGKMGRYGASEMLRNKNMQSAMPLIQNVGQQISTKIRPNRKYKTDLDGRGFDIHKAIGKLPAPKGGWTLPGHHYTGPFNPLEKQLKFNPKTGEILEIYQQPTGKTDAVSMQHDVDYSVCSGQKDERECKNKADRKMVAALDNIPWRQRQWGHAAARNLINSKQKLGLGVPKNERRF